MSPYIKAWLTLVISFGVMVLNLVVFALNSAFFHSRILNTLLGLIGILSVIGIVVGVPLGIVLTIIALSRKRPAQAETPSAHPPTPTQPQHTADTTPPAQPPAAPAA